MRRTQQVNFADAREYGSRSRNAKLSRLFERWRESLPKRMRGEFHGDGIVEEDTFDSQADRILFVILEPNAKGRQEGSRRSLDLRQVWADEPLGKDLQVNLARWTLLLLGDAHRFPKRLNGKSANVQLRRVAVMNLKKAAGTSVACHGVIGIHAWRDRVFIRSQVRIIAPTLIVACGWETNRIFGCVATKDSHWEAPEDRSWTCEGVPVLPLMYHPAVREPNARSAFNALVKVARAAGMISRRT